MKSLEDFIKEQENEFWRTYPCRFLHCEPPYWELERRNKWIDYFFDGLECPQNVLEAAMDYDKDPILEMLNTHSVDKLINKIRKEYPTLEIQREPGTNDTNLLPNEEPKSGFSICDEKTKLDELINDEKLNNILSYFNYYFTQFYYEKNTSKWYALFEPLYSKKIKDFEKRNNGVAYHITSVKLYEKIQKEGLKIKGSQNKENGYRYFPQKIYLILPNTKSKIERNEIINNVIKTLNKQDDYKVLQISLHNLPNFTFYEDVTMNTDKEHYIYTYQNIPTKYIKDVTYKFNKQ